MINCDREQFTISCHHIMLKISCKLRSSMHIFSIMQYGKKCIAAFNLYIIKMQKQTYVLLINSRYILIINYIIEI